MKKKTNDPLIIGVLIVGAILAYFFLNFKFNSKEKFAKNAGFSRKLYHLNLTPITSIKTGVEQDKYSIVGISNNKIILSVPSTQQILTFSINGSATENETYDFKNTDFSTLTLNDSKGHLDLFSASQKSYYAIDVKTFKITEKYVFDTYFSRGARINNTFLLLKQKPGTYRSMFTLYRISNNKNPVKVTELDIFKQNSMTEDGLLKSNGNNAFAFVSFFKNSFFLLDTNAKLPVTGRTIDTISTGPKAELIANGTRLVYTEPVRLTNNEAHFIGHILAIESMVTSDTKNENGKKNALIDLYDQHGIYLYSLSFEGKGGKRPDKVYLKNGLAIVAYEDELFIYNYALGSNKI